ncbi:MAG: hypothetical protein EOS54_11570 [Mesorhizobium sp.]|uniref:hypothetical protein n=1 Tax=unclassified Mesorhizobium TaxID=325217 RepID=UPI000F754996|nr:MULTISPECIES: hypothetical protein [unclassified Mesorhizobium]AZO47677.1 hypothetical protein EJ073_07400 [Mesorhizobium sp. M4B.F.Ca.ET.058.02.1.1]RWC53932.1 MAG: hypothetical protein EOS54_11570 [Mesorhizobium sp.]RWD13414.1 MAG: hypothetical protein EOS74_20345 [Mesorhizobium sp.]RWD54036.1 MAG: hypothetical protein EOS75_24905 [Mesorhizobium sp.]TIW06883.1 MAG: hypothetical protein E5V66_33055 [Mesorhizobium sp.]
MARIAVITHEFDRFQSRRGLLLRRDSPYMLFDLLEELKRRGHSVRILAGTAARPEADIAVLHVDATVTPAEYVEYARAFPFCLNIGATDISKRRVSGAVIGRGDGWQGPVIVKSSLNNLGTRERSLNRRSRRAGKPEPFPRLEALDSYRVHGSLADVPTTVFDREDLVVEKFVPEPEPDGFGARFWLFCGERERCTRHVSPQSLVKGDDTIRREPVPVPDELRALRRQLGFDYGKFDFVMHEGRAVLLDANKTPGRARRLSSFVAAGNANLADGFEGLIRQVT